MPKAKKAKTSAGAAEVKEDAAEANADSDDWDADGDKDNSSSDVETEHPKSTTPSSKKGRAKQNSILKKKACICCPSKKTENSMFCTRHRAVDGVLCYQAKMKGPEAYQTYKDDRKDPVKLQMAVITYQKQNPDGTFRKCLIEWGEFKRIFLKAFSHGTRNEEELMSLGRFKWWWKIETDNACDDDACTAEFFKRVSDGCDTDGEGASLKLWVCVGKRRYKDVIRAIENTFEEGSRRKKQIAEADLDAIRSFVKEGEVDTKASFFKDQADPVESTASDDSDSNESDGKDAIATKKKKPIDMDTALTDMYGALGKLLDAEISLFVELEKNVDEIATGYGDMAATLDEQNRFIGDKYSCTLLSRLIINNNNNDIIINHNKQKQQH